MATAKSNGISSHHCLARLEYHQNRISDFLLSAGPTLELADASVIKELALIRWGLMRHLREYQLFKHCEIFDPLIGSHTIASHQAKLLKLKCTAMGAAYNDHVQRWSLVGPASDWPRYRSEALAMSDRIRQHLSVEGIKVRELLELTK